MKSTDHRGGMDGDLAEAALGKPSKVGQRPERRESEQGIPEAEPVPDQPGFVYHPVSGKTVDVRGIPAGLMVRQGIGEMFRVPKMGYVITAEAYQKAVGNFSGLWSHGDSEGVSVVSCRPAHWETQWDDGTPWLPEPSAVEDSESLLE